MMDLIRLNPLRSKGNLNFRRPYAGCLHCFTTADTGMLPHLVVQMN